MQVHVNIGFEQLLKIVKELPAARLKQLKAEIEKGIEAQPPVPDLESLLLNGPVATPEEIEIIGQNRKAINAWRTK